MIYNIVDFGDIHWGVLDADTQFENLELINEFITQFQQIDLVVITGDYFDSKLPLNSKAAILSLQWFYKFLETCQESNVKRVRIIKGTEDHDNDQLEAFRALEDSSGFFKIFNENTAEETLPGLKCIYCPDETIPTKEYMIKYLNNIFDDINIGFFHGSFDTMLPDMVTQISEDTSVKNVIYEYNFWKKTIRGPMISGHWHDGIVDDHLIYIGSYERWEFNEENPKGFGFIRYNTDTEEYFYKKIVNKYASLYITYTIYSSLYNTIDDYSNLIESVNLTLNKYKSDGTKIKIRILINATDDKPENENLFLGIRQYYINNPLVKIVIKNKLKKDKNDNKVKQHIETKSKFGFVLDKKRSATDKIQQFILMTKGKELPIDIIDGAISKYLK